LLTGRTTVIGKHFQPREKFIRSLTICLFANIGEMDEGDEFHLKDTRFKVLYNHGNFVGFVERILSSLIGIKTRVSLSVC